MISKLRNKAQKGFTLIELMIVVAIIGILAAVAIPAFMRYIAKSKTSEASQMVKKISDGARAYYMDNPVPDFGELPVQFPAPTVGPTPQANSCCDAGGAGTKKCPVNGANWEDANGVWPALQFSMDDPHYYVYTYETTDETAHFTARANGDIDCDGTIATFEMKGRVQNGAVEGMGGIKEVNPIE